MNVVNKASVSVGKAARENQHQVMMKSKRNSESRKWLAIKKSPEMTWRQIG
jgi:hypothetical protein